VKLFLWIIVHPRTELKATLFVRLTVLVEVMTRIRAVAWKAVVAPAFAAERTKKCNGNYLCYQYLFM
jgi:hypothetical protein